MTKMNEYIGLGHAMLNTGSANNISKGIT